MSIFRQLHLREEDDVPDGRFTGQQHDEAVDAHAETTRRRHAVVQRVEEVFVDTIYFAVGVRATDYRSFILPLKPIVGLVFNLFKNIWQKIGEIKSPIAPYMAPFGFIINVWDLLKVCFSGKTPALWMEDVPFACSDPIDGVSMLWLLLAMHNRRK